MKTVLLAALVVLVAIGIWMANRHARQQEFALRNLEIQQKLLRHRDRIDTLCTTSEKATFEKASAEDLDDAVTRLRDVADIGPMRRYIGCMTEYRALIDDKAREQQLRKEYNQ